MIRSFIGTMLLGIALVGIAMTTWAQEESIRPGINKPFENPDVENWLARFGMDVADIGAGTGFYTMLFAQEVGPDGTVYALDIAENFITYIEGTAKELGLANVKGIANPPDATTLAPNSVDVVFLAHAYHHFEYPYKMLDSIRSALRPDGVRAPLPMSSGMPGSN
jgi:ubiquinone/menaquinone biosynthesis C-methylase UbiE